MTHTARVLVKAPAAEITGRVPRGIVVEPVDDNTCVVHATANSIEMLSLYLGMLDAEFPSRNRPSYWPASRNCPNVFPARC